MAGITSGPPRKPSTDRKGHRKYDTVYIDAAEVDVLAEVPHLADAKTMLVATREAWDRFWRSPVAKVLVPASDLPALTRMFHLTDELERCRRLFREQRIVKGSMGQQVVNPLGSFMLSLAKEVRALEDRFGASVVSRLRLSIDLNEAHRSLDELNRRKAAEGAHDVEVQDPRALGRAAS